ncbi:unnamed protein product, partial [Scytosiphon promiscuus]
GAAATLRLILPTTLSSSHAEALDFEVRTPSCRKPGLKNLTRPIQVDTLVGVMRATPVLSAMALASCRGGVVTAASTNAAAAAAVATATVQYRPPSSRRPSPAVGGGATAAAAAARGKSSPRRGGARGGAAVGHGSRGRGGKGRGSSGGSSGVPGSGRSPLFFQNLALASRPSSTTMGSLTRQQQVSRRSFARALSSYSGGRDGTTERRIRPARVSGASGRRRSGPLPLSRMMMMASPQVTDKEIMREFVTVAASEAASAVKGKPPSAVLEGGKGKTRHNGDAGAGAGAPGGKGG